LKPPVPEKKIKLSVRAPIGIFETCSNNLTDQDRINGWSFVASKPQELQQEDLMNKLK